jgi:Ca2+-binding RTX toxin-like protein
VGLSWKAPGDDWLCGKAAHYQVIASQGPIHHPGDGSVIAEADAADAPGAAVTKNLTAADIGTADHVAVIYRDEAGNWGILQSTSVPPVHPPRGHCHHRILGTPANDVLRGTPRSDRIRGGDGDDRISGLGGADCLGGGLGSDRLFGGGGHDVLHTRGKGHDKVDCGAGDDIARVGRADRVKTNCETVRIGPP